MEKTLCSLKCRPPPRATPLPPVEEVAGGGGKGRMTISFRLHTMQISSVKNQEYGTKLYYYPLSTNLKRFAGQVTRFSKSRSIIFWAPTAAIDVDVVGAIAKGTPLNCVGSFAI